MKKEASIIIHQITTAVHPEKKLLDIWKEIELYDHIEQEEVLEELDKIRQEQMAGGSEQLGNMLEKLITDIRVGVRAPRSRNVPKQF
ncbi:MAG: hypothetical protein WBA16_04820 [Nonlabens sp.]